MNRSFYAMAAVAITLVARPLMAITWSGYSTSLPGTTLATRPELAGNVIASQDFQLHADPSHGLVYPDAILHNYVVRENATGTLDFYFQLTSTSTQNQNVFQMAINGFNTGANLDVDQLNPGTPYDQFFASRLGPDEITTGSPARGTGTFLLSPGESTAPLFIHTTTSLFDSSGSFLFIPNASISGTFAPVGGGSATFVPEPASVSLLGIGAGALALRFRRRGV